MFQSEIGIELLYQLQLEFCENLEENPGGHLRHQGDQVEARWALVDLVRIPLNSMLC